ncbi:hypothetical protein DCAR_0312859 [Daucus carota subsp. sativus]|uniref:Protein TIC 214 n=1 Tax=Daucus carota subsp. sativus TaxID=79200 RepID=A0AAF0WSA6_DAUCS|nr:hypothetical protein DCAR_0312859 [Daucus carota subsp. sativus]
MVKTKQKFVIKEISKKVPRWSYKLITELEFLLGTAHEGLRLSDTFKKKGWYNNL